MSQSPSFFTNSKFYAKNYFPFGFNRSGEFTVEQAELLTKHGKAYEALHSELRAPATDEERAFLAVCRGEKEASTPHERAWLRFCEKVKEHSSVSAFGSIDRSSTSSNEDSADDEDW